MKPLKTSIPKPHFTQKKVIFANIPFKIKLSKIWVFYPKTGCRS